MFVQTSFNIRAVITRSGSAAFNIYRWVSSGRMKRFRLAAVFSINNQVSSQIFSLAARAKDPVDRESDSLFWIELRHVTAVGYMTHIK